MLCNLETIVKLCQLIFCLEMDVPSHLEDILYGEGRAEKEKNSFLSYVNVKVEVILALRIWYKKIISDFLRFSNFSMHNSEDSSGVEPVWFNNSNLLYVLWDRKDAAAYLSH